jgi:DNA-binding winged helix-turn-helix (wHTH) protein
LDSANQCIWLKQQRIQLPPKAFSVLAYLADNPGRIVTKEELLEAVWPDTFVQEAVLKACILDIRKALDDDSRNPRSIATVHRRGYRFIDSPLEQVSEPSAGAGSAHADAGAGLTVGPGLLGRRSELKRMSLLLERVFAGKRQVAFVIGEPGIGKSTLVTYFLNRVAPPAKLRVLRGQCIEQFGAQEAYYPVFDALSRGAREAVIPEFLTVLRTYAPTWLMELPGVVSVQDREILKQETLGASRDRMLREMTEAIEILASETTLLMVLEDLHWSDLSTLDLISSIANRTESARLMLIATYRPVEAILADHPVKTLKQGLLARGVCSEIELESLDENAVREFLDLRFPKHRFPADFASLVHSHTEGNPLFMTNVLDYAVSREAIVRCEGGWELASAEGDFDLRVPEGLTKIIERQIARLTAEEQSALEVASVIGATFAVPVMPGFGFPETDSLEVCCEGLVERNLFIRAAGVSEFVPGNIGARYQFIHGL